MNKIKKVWVENKVLFVLALILILCLVIVITVSMTYFYGQSDSVYGNRLDKTEEIPLSNEKLTEIETKLKENESVTKVSTNLKGLIVYVDIDYADETKMEDAKKVAESIVELFSDEELSLYEIEFTIKAKNSTGNYTLMGARNSNGSEAVVWNNYNISEEESSAKK